MRANVLKLFLFKETFDHMVLNQHDYLLLNLLEKQACNPFSKIVPNF